MHPYSRSSAQATEAHPTSICNADADSDPRNLRRKQPWLTHSTISVHLSTTKRLRRSPGGDTHTAERALEVNHQQAGVFYFGTTSISTTVELRRRMLHKMWHVIERG